MKFNLFIHTEKRISHQYSVESGNTLLKRFLFRNNCLDYCTGTTTRHVLFLEILEKFLTQCNVSVKSYMLLQIPAVQCESDGDSTVKQDELSIQPCRPHLHSCLLHLLRVLTPRRPYTAHCSRRQEWLPPAMSEVSHLQRSMLFICGKQVICCLYSWNWGHHMGFWLCSTRRHRTQHEEIISWPTDLLRHSVLFPRVDGGVTSLDTGKSLHQNQYARPTGWVDHTGYIQWR